MTQNKPYREQKLQYTNDGRLLDENGNAVMMDWEKPIMEKSAEIICKNGGRVLNVGFGMGIIDSFIQTYEIKEHWIIEPHIDVYIKMLQDGWHLKPNVKILFGDWQFYFKYLPLFDGIYFDTWEEDTADFFKYVPNIMKDDGVFCYFNNPRGDEKQLHLLERDSIIFSYWADIELETFDLAFIDSLEKQRTDGKFYWSTDWTKYYCPIIKKMKK